jgi:two-component system, sensor histidine kinase LadS
VWIYKLVAVRYLLLCLLCWCAPHFVAAQEFDRLSDDSPRLTLAAPLQWQAVPKGAMLSPDAFQAAGTAQGFAVYTPSVRLPTSKQNDVWLRFALPATSAPEQWYLRIPRLSLERATLYSQDTSNLWTQVSAGGLVAMNHWPVPARRPTFALLTRTEGVQTYYLKLEHYAAIAERPELMSGNEFIDHSARVGVVIGLTFGLFFLLGALGLLAAWQHRERNFLWFALTTFLLLLVQLVLIGHAGQSFWPSSSYLNLTMPWLSALWLLAATTWFCAQVSFSREAFPKIHNTAIAVVTTLLLLSMAYAMAYQDFPRLVLNAVVVLGMLWVLSSTAWMAWRSQPWLWHVVGGLAPIALAMLVRLAYNMGWVGQVEIAQLVSVVAGCLGMLVIYRALLLHNREAQLALQRESATESIDVTTGLALARVVDVRLPLVMARSERFDEPCGVLMVRWLGYNEFMEPLSSTQRGAALSHLGARLRKLGRPIDTVARLDDDHFLYLIEAPISRDRLNALGTKILSVCMRPGRPQVDNNEYNVHIAIWASTKGNLPAPQVIESLRTRLNQMGHGTSRRVQFVDSAPSSRPGEGNSEISNVTGTGALSSAAIVAKINAIEASPIVPTIATRQPNPR